MVQGMSSLEREQERRRLRHAYTQTLSCLKSCLSLTLPHTRTGGMAKQLCYLIGDTVCSKEEESIRLRQEIGKIKGRNMGERKERI